LFALIPLPERQCRYKRNLEPRSECVFVALVIQHAKCIRRVISSSVACLVVPYFSKFSHKRIDFRKRNVMEYKMCVFWFSLLLIAETFLILRRTERDTIKYFYWYSCKVPVIPVILMKLECFHQIFEKYSNPSSMKILLVGADFFHACRRTDGQTDRHDKTKSCFSQFWLCLVMISFDYDVFVSLTACFCEFSQNGFTNLFDLFAIQ
jgi:hypothetical protein